MAITIEKLPNGNVEIIRDIKFKSTFDSTANIFKEDERVFITDSCGVKDDFNASEVTSVTRADGTVVTISSDSDLLYTELKTYFFTSPDGVDSIQNVDAGISFDALGAVEVSQLTTQIDLKQSAGELVEYIDTKTIGTGAYSYDSVTGSTNMTVTTTGDKVVSQTFQRTNYQTGKPKQIKQTLFNFHPQSGVVKKFGYYSGDYGAPYSNNLDGFWYESTENGITLNVFRNGTQIISRPQSEWNGDYDFDSIDWEFNVLAIPRFVWLGIDQVQFSIKIGAEKVVLHTEYFTNMSLKGVYMRYANQPLRWEIESTSGAGEFNYICATAEKQGSLNQLGEIKGVDRGSTHQNANSTASTYANIGIALDETKPESFRSAVIDIINATAIGITADDFAIRIYRNPTITGTALSWQQIPNSAVKYFVGADDNIITDGAVLDSNYTARRQQGGALIDNAIKMGVDLDGNPDIFVIGIQPVTPNLDVLGSVNFRELS